MNNAAMSDRDAAQAEMLIQALNDVRDKMIIRMTWLEKHDFRRDVAVLRRDIEEAEAHISRLESRYLGRVKPPPLHRLRRGR